MTGRLGLRPLLFEAALDEALGEIRDDFPGDLLDHALGEQLGGAARDGLNHLWRQLLKRDLSRGSSGGGGLALVLGRGGRSSPRELEAFGQALGRGRLLARVEIFARRLSGGRLILGNRRRLLYRSGV